MKRRFSAVVCSVLAAVIALTVLPTVHVRAASDRLEQYRAWMEEARAEYPYRESVDTMWDVMMCESGGSPNVVSRNRLYHGLFQYHKQTWAGKWNPYRRESIFDPKAQIFATAKAWSEGNQRWWGCYKRR